MKIFTVASFSFIIFFPPFLCFSSTSLLILQSFTYSSLILPRRIRLLKRIVNAHQYSAFPSHKSSTYVSCARRTNFQVSKENRVGLNWMERETSLRRLSARNFTIWTFLAFNLSFVWILMQGELERINKDLKTDKYFWNIGISLQPLFSSCFSELADVSRSVISVTTLIFIKELKSSTALQTSQDLLKFSSRTSEWTFQWTQRCKQKN